MHNIKAEGRDVVLSPWQYFSQQMLLTHFFCAPIWITGVIAFLVRAPLQARTAFWDGPTWSASPFSSLSKERITISLRSIPFISPPEVW